MSSLYNTLVWLLALQIIRAQAVTPSINDVSDETVVNLSELFHHNGTLPSVRPFELEKRSATSPLGKQQGCYWNVSGVGIFNSHLRVTDWATTLSDSNTPLVAYTSTGYPCPQLNGNYEGPLWCVRYDLVNIGLNSSDNTLTLTVPGGQQPVLVSCAKFGTNWTDILYGSVRTIARSSNVPGTIHGAFFYHNDTQEADIEIQTGNPGYAHWTNQLTHPKSNGDAPSYTSPVQSSWTTYHEYRLDWLPGMTKFYLDGVLKKTITENVPSVPGSWLWNAWTKNGSFSGSPLDQDSVFHIQSIDLYVNRTSVAKCGA